MIVISNEQTVWFDVDNTLIMWDADPSDLAKDGVYFECPGAWYLENDQLKQGLPVKELLLPHKKHIEQIKKHKLRNHGVVVWSQGGAQWAECVVKTLKLENYVDLVIAKPLFLYDDLPSHEFMPKNIWVKDE